MEKIKKDRIKEIAKYKRRSVARLTVRDYGDINNVDNYILNYSPSRKNNDLENRVESEGKKSDQESEKESEESSNSESKQLDSSKIINKNNLNIKLELDTDKKNNNEATR